MFVCSSGRVFVHSRVCEFVWLLVCSFVSGVSCVSCVFRVFFVLVCLRVCVFVCLCDFVYVWVSDFVFVWLCVLFSCGCVFMR